MITGEPASADTLTRNQVVDRIISMNPTAPAAFLSSFTDQALKDYLDHLTVGFMPRGRHSRWVRRGDLNAVVAAEPRD